jgi:hypothetical protein
LSVVVALTVRLPPAEPPVVGLNTTFRVIEQLAATATPLAQVLVGVSPAASENTELEKERLPMPIGSIGAAPVLVIVSVAD